MTVSFVVAQFKNSFIIEDNLERILKFISIAEKDEILVLHEGALSGYSDDISFLKQINHEELVRAMELLKSEVKKRNIHLIFGSCIKEHGQWYNAGLCFSHSSEDFIYRKINLATHERGYFQAGNELSVFPLVAQGKTLRIGIQLCREIRFPEQWKALALKNTDVFVYLTNAISGNNMDVWRSHLISRAAENQRFLISSNVAHSKQHCPTMVISPDGTVLAEVRSEEEIFIRLKLELNKVSNWYLDQSRIDIVK